MNNKREFDLKMHSSVSLSPPDLCVCPRWSPLANCEPQDHTSLNECRAGSHVLPRPFPRPFVRIPRSVRPLASPTARVSSEGAPGTMGDLGDFEDEKELSRSVGRHPAGPSGSSRRRRAGSEGEIGHRGTWEFGSKGEIGHRGTWEFGSKGEIGHRGTWKFGSEGEIEHRGTWEFDLRRVVRLKSFRSFSDVAQEYSHGEEYGKGGSKPTGGNSDVRAASTTHDRPRRTRKYVSGDTTRAHGRVPYPSDCDGSFVDTGFSDGDAQYEANARHRISGSDPPGNLLVPHTFPADTGTSRNTVLNKTTHADVISSADMNRMNKPASHTDNKQIVEKNETRLARKSTHNSVRTDLAGGPSKPRSRLCRPKKRERRYLSSGVPQLGHGRGGGRSNRKAFPKRRLEGGRYSILLRRGQRTAPSAQRDLEGQLVLNMRRVEHHNETRSVYDVEEVVDPEINDCFCEYSSQLKCLGERITKIPSRIVGNVTWFIVRMSSVQHLDVEVMAQYPSLRIMSLEENNLTAIPRGVFSKQNILKHLYMSKNNIRTLDKDSCQGLRSLLTFFLDKNSLEIVELSCFIHTPALITL
ncbi:uncharacterized protein [Penaeus vannamei]|uniref:uncharacterized protein n=1 Tax=Penaeus vannamei TaxID=6689 RepID=UPI00387F8EA4